MTKASAPSARPVVLQMLISKHGDSAPKTLDLRWSSPEPFVAMLRDLTVASQGACEESRDALYGLCAGFADYASAAVAARRAHWSLRGFQLGGGEQLRLSALITPSGAEMLASEFFQPDQTMARNDLRREAAGSMVSIEADRARPGLFLVPWADATTGERLQRVDRELFAHNEKATVVQPSAKASAREEQKTQLAPTTVDVDKPQSAPAPAPERNVATPAPAPIKTKLPMWGGVAAAVVVVAGLVVAMRPHTTPSAAASSAPTQQSAADATSAPAASTGGAKTTSPAAPTNKNVPQPTVASGYQKPQQSAAPKPVGNQQQGAIIPTTPPSNSGSSMDFTAADIPSLLSRANSSAGRGDYKKARYYYNMVLRIDGGNAEAHEGLSRLPN